jgi:hypothetical protein
VAAGFEPEFMKLAEHTLPLMYSHPCEKYSALQSYFHLQKLVLPLELFIPSIPMVFKNPKKVKLALLM